MGETVDDFLAHYGVKGMRWGVRKRREGGGSGNGGRKKNKNGAHLVIDSNYTKNADGTKGSGSDARGRSTAHLTDQQLRNRIARIEMEKRYAQLTDKTSAGKKWLKGLGKKLAENAQTAIANTVTNQVTNALTSAVTKARADQKAKAPEASPESASSKPKAEAPKPKKEGNPPYNPNVNGEHKTVMAPTPTVRKAPPNAKAGFHNFMKQHGPRKSKNLKDYGDYKFEAGSVIDENGNRVRPKKR